MSFALSNVVDLLEALEALYIAVPPLSSTALSQKAKGHITSWFAFHLPIIRNSPRTLVSIFSFLLPDLRADRTYALRENALSKIIGQCLLLGTRRQNALKNWRSSNEGDFSSVVQRIMAQAENPSADAVTVEDAEEVLDRLAARSRFSSDALRTSFAAMFVEPDMETSVQDALEGLYRKLTSKEGKWVTRAILKCHLPVVIPENHILVAYHFLLPCILSIQHDLGKACNLICSLDYCSITHSPANLREERQLLELMSARILKPEVGTKVGRPEFIKARSCKHASGIAAGRRMSMERKYDGEYCQIHIDLSTNNNEWLKIFSKSGRDSTSDRVRVHDTIKQALNIDKPEKRDWTRCIIEGELVVYNDREKRIMEFYHIRSHVNRAGSYIGNAKDGSRDSRSHLMILLFDCLLYDNLSLLHLPHHRRMEFLQKILPRPLPGRFEFAERVDLDFSQGETALDTMRTLFAAGIVKRWEGFVLKPIDEPYLSLVGRNVDGNVKSYGWVGGKAAWIKLKKDYIQGCGDTGDFAVIGGAADRGRGWERKLKCGALTVFHVGCLLNKEDVQKTRAKPRFKVIFQVTYNISKPDLEWINLISRFETIPYKEGQEVEQFDLQIVTGIGMVPMDCIFTKPLVFEIIGGGFEKPTNCTFYTPRHPRVCKIHWDRNYLEAMSFSELQDAAKEALNIGGEDYEDMQTESQWIEKLLEKGLGAEESNERILDAGAIKIAKAEEKPELKSLGREIRATTLLFTPALRNVHESMIGLCNIKQPNTPGGRSSQGSSTSFNSSKFSTENISTKRIAPPSSPESDYTLPPAKKICLVGLMGITKISGKHTKQQPLDETLPLQTQIGASIGVEIPCSKNGHSSISPLHGATIFLPHYLIKFPKLIERITNHEAEIIHLLPTTAEKALSLMPTNKKGIVLVESSKITLAKKTLKNLYDLLKPANEKEGQSYGFEMYDWRIVNHNQPEGTWEIDWSLWHIWSVV